MNNQENDETRAYRYIQFQQSLTWKGHRCDNCGRVAGLQMHEIVSRAQTLNNPEARRLSFQKELTALLCEACHSRAHNGVMDLQLLNKNILVYGYESVEDALNELKAVMRSTILLIMPKKEDANG